MWSSPSLHDVGSARIAVRTFGSGPPLLLVHGWPLWGFTWRKLVPLLEGFTSYVVDLPGTGSTVCAPQNDYGFRGQAANLAKLLERLELGPVPIVAQDTGATIVRQLAVVAPERVGRLVLLNTEIPGHRPPWIQTFQATIGLPGAAAAFRLALQSRVFRRSSLGFGGCFVDLDLLDGDFHEGIVRPLIEDPARLDGIIRYLRGIDWALVDEMATLHRQITSEVLLVWSTEDPTFPIERARALPALFKRCAGLVPVEGARLLLHEERPHEVARHVLEFLAAQG